MSNGAFSQLGNTLSEWGDKTADFLFDKNPTANDYLNAGSKYTMEQLRKIQLAKTLGLAKPELGALSKFSGFMKDIATPVGLGLSFYNSINQIRLQNKQLNAMDKQLKMATEQWQNTKQEMNAIRKARSNIVKQYGN